MPLSLIWNNGLIINRGSKGQVLALQEYSVVQRATSGKPANDNDTSSCVSEPDPWDALYETYLDDGEFEEYPEYLCAPPWHTDMVGPRSGSGTCPSDPVWLTQAQMVELFGSSKANISEHISNIYQQEELLQEATVRNFRTVRKEGNRMVTRNIDHYNLDMIISVGFRVNSQQGIRFRQWANKVLKEYLLRGYVIHQQMLQMEQRIDSKLMIQHDEMQRIKETQTKQQQQLDFFIRTSTPPAEMVFFEGDFYTARVALENLVRTATRRAIIVDAYVSALTLDIILREFHS